MLGLVVWDFKDEEGNSHGDGKANVGKQTFSWLRRGNGTQGDSVVTPVTLLTHHTQPIFSAHISEDCSVPGTGPLSKLFRQLRGRQQGNFLSLLFLKNNCCCC